MLANGTLRTLTAADPDPYPDAICIDLDATDDEDGGGNCSISKATRRKKPTALQQAVAKLRRE